jgi:hypothetical protein
MGLSQSPEENLRMSAPAPSQESIPMQPDRPGNILSGNCTKFARAENLPPITKNLLQKLRKVRRAFGHVNI